MELSEHGKKILAYKIKQYFAGMITAQQYMIAVKAIYKSELTEDQSWEVEEYGYMAKDIN